MGRYSSASGWRCSRKEAVLVVSIQIRWEDIYVTGIQGVDEQHRHFVELINRMSTTSDAEMQSETGKALAAELLDYADLHFASEEALMRQHDYPDVDSHVEEHRTLAAEATDKAIALAGGRVTRAALVMFLWNWLVAHTNLADKALGSFLRERGVT
jgi:hemerythrin